MNWNEVVERITPSIVKIETPRGHGTGFLCFYNDSKTLCGIATANHVLEHEHNWQEPIRIHHFPSNGTVLLRNENRVIFPDQFRDSAVIVITTGLLDLPQQTVPLLPTENRLPIGMEVGWLGFPGIDEDALCFFSGAVSAWRDFRKAYLIDGVAINGISGGPVVYFHPEDGVQVVGAITAYRANRLTGETLPGLSVAQDVSHFHDIIAHIRSIEEAKKNQEPAQQQQAAGPSAPAPIARPNPENTTE